MNRFYLQNLSCSWQWWSLPNAAMSVKPECYSISWAISKKHCSFPCSVLSAWGFGCLTSEITPSCSGNHHRILGSKEQDRRLMRFRHLSLECFSKVNRRALLSFPCARWVQLLTPLAAKVHRRPLFGGLSQWPTSLSKKDVLWVAGSAWQLPGCALAPAVSMLGAHAAPRAVRAMPCMSVQITAGGKRVNRRSSSHCCVCIRCVAGMPLIRYSTTPPRHPAGLSAC